MDFESKIKEVEESIKELKALKKSKRIDAKVADSILEYGKSLIDLFQSQIKKNNKKI